MSKDTVLRVTDDERIKIKEMLYTKSDEEIENCLQSLKEWISKQPHLPQDEDDHILRQMLGLNKFSVERTKSKLEVYYSARNIIPQFFTNNYPLHPSIQQLFDTCFFLPLPFLTEKLERVTLCSLRKECLKIEFIPEDFHRLLFTTVETRLNHDTCAGDVNIYDFSLLNLGIVSRVSPMSLLNLTKFLLGAYSDSIKNMHFINVAPFAQTLIAIVKSGLKTKLAQRVVVHKDLNSLHQYVKPEILPKELGGKLKSILELQGEWRKFLESNNDWIVRRSKLRSNEKLRIGSSPDLFGIQGSFRQLVID